MTGKQYWITLLILAGTSLGYSQQNTAFICNAQTTCRNCIQASPLCSWCADPNFVGSRCYLTTSNRNCSNNNLQDPRGSVQGTSNDPFTDLNQISPLNLNISLRRGQPLTFQVKVTPARNYPLDLYLLMDLSYSMRDDLENLKTLGGQIATTIAGITTNYNLGFGAFVDKPIAPYVSIIPSRLQDPCLGNCEGPYSFRHVIALGNDSAVFNSGVQARRISGNLDAPEGGFDGFLQSIVCENLIGWRKNARHLLLYITDAGFHFAGDGKLGGAIIPHTGECLMGQQVNNEPVDYNQYDRLDYPSVGQIRQKLREFDIIPLFAVTDGAKTFYDALAEELEGADVGELETDSSNVVELIEESYLRVSQRVLISPDNAPGIAFNITPVTCPRPEGSTCNGLQIGQTAVFNITTTLLQCSSEFTSGPRSINFRILGFGSFQIQVNAICGCECENNEIPNSPDCTNGNGTLTCGICQCNSGRFGERCQCDGTGQIAGTNITCGRGPNGLECSGRGTCICGRCNCDTFPDGRLFFGVTCECDNFQCDRDSAGRTCGGPDRGECSCDGQCECLTSPLSGLRYTGSACDCSPDNNTCINPDMSDRVCSGRGTCECGECVNCSPYFIGQYCETCTNISACPVASCDANLLCARCAAGLLTDGCDQCNATRVNNVGQGYRINGSQAVTCDFTDDDGCEYRYFVALDDNGNSRPVHLDTNIDCPNRVAPWIIAVSIIGGLLLIGALILLAIKLLLMLLDYIEVKKFMKEIQDPAFRKNENPLFQSPNKEYKNPVYGK